MIDKYKISVLICTYNGEKYIEKQLCSICNQTVVPNEIVIVDDCSKDNTIGIVKKIKNKNRNIQFKIVKNEHNVGFVANFMNGLKYTTGDLIFLSDQDDIWYPEKIVSVAKKISENSDALVVNNAYKLIDENDNEIKSFLAIKQRNDEKLERIEWKDFIKSPRYPGMSMTIKKELLSFVMNIPNEIIPAHDWLLNEAACRKSGMYYYRKKLGGYRQHSANTVGATKDGDCKGLLKRRLHTLMFFRKTHEYLKYLYGNDDETGKFINRLMSLDDKRMENFEKRSMMKIIFMYLKYRNEMSVRCFAGDLYSCVKLKWNGV